MIRQFRVDISYDFHAEEKNRVSIWHTALLIITDWYPKIHFYIRSTPSIKKYNLFDLFLTPRLPTHLI